MKIKLLYIILILGLLPLQSFSQALKDQCFGEGMEYLKKKQYDDAIKKFNQAIALDSAHVNAYTFRGASYFAKGDYTNAFSDYNKAVEISGSSTVYRNRGYAYYELEEYDKAMIDYDKAIEIDPKRGENYRERGIIYHKTKEYEKALSDYNKAIELGMFWDMHKLFYSRGTLYLEQGKYSEALSDFNTAISKYSKDADYYINRAMVHYKLNDNENAIKDIEKAIELNPSLETELRQKIDELK